MIADAGYGAEANFRSRITERGLRYVVGVKSTNTVWAPDTKASCRGRAFGTMPRDDAGKPVSVEELALGLAERAWRKIGWRQGTNEKLSGRRDSGAEQPDAVGLALREIQYARAIQDYQMAWTRGQAMMSDG